MNFISKTLCVFVFVWFTVLSKLVASLKEADSLTSEQELSFLQTLLQSKEINALVNVHSKVGKVCKDEKCAPLMSSSIQVRHIPSLPESHHIHESTLNTVYKFKCICCSVCIWKKKQVALEVLEQLSQRCHISPLCKEIFYLLQKPHFQVHFERFSHQFKRRFLFSSFNPLNVIPFLLSPCENGTEFIGHSWCNRTEGLLSTSTRNTDRSGWRRRNG